MSNNNIRLRASAQTLRQAAAAKDAMADGANYAHRRVISRMRDDATARRIARDNYMSYQAARAQVAAIKTVRHLRRRKRKLLVGVGRRATASR